VWFIRPNIARLRQRRDIRGLLRALERRDAAVRREAADALAAIADPAATKALCGLGDDPDSGVCSVARSALDRIAARHGATSLIAALDCDEEPWVQEEAASALGRLGDEQAVGPLGRMLQRARDADAQRAAVEALGQIGGPKAVNPIAACLASSDETLREVASSVLGVIGDAAVARLCALTKSADAAQCIGAARALARIGNAESAKHVRRLIAHQRMDVRLEGVRALLSIGDAGRQALLFALRDTETREAAVVALKAIGVPEDPEIRAWCAAEDGDRETLRRLGPLAVGPLQAMLRHRKAGRRFTAANILTGMTAAEDNETRAWRAMASQDWDAAVLIGEAAVEPLCFALADDDTLVSHGAARSLERIGLPAKPGSREWQRVWRELDDLNHHTAGCECSVCGKVTHQWQGRTCTVCGAVNTCPHRLVDGKCTHCGHVFLGPLSRDERVAVSNLNPLIYDTIVAEKEGKETPGIHFASGDDSKLQLLRRLEVDDLKRLRQSVASGQDGDRVAPGDQSLAARHYRAAVDLNPYNDLALLSYGVVLAEEGKLAEGIKWVEKARAVNPSSDRIRRNLDRMRADLHRPPATPAASAAPPSGVGIDACGVCGCPIDPRKHAIRDSKITRTLSKRLASVGVRVTHVRCPRCGTESQHLRKG